MKALVAVVACAGCNQIFGVEKTHLIDAKFPDATDVLFILPDAPDRDHDTIPDEADNCPDDYNPGQEDFDGDKVGDVCDNCPLVGNSQTDNYDGDGVGDACDLNPDSAGDCILLVDTFGDPASFANHWTVYSAGGTTVAASAHKVTFPPSGKTLAIFSKTTLAAPPNAIHVHAQKTAPSDGEFGLAAMVNPDFSAGFECGVAIDTTMTSGPLSLIVREVGSTPASDPLSSTPFPGGLLMRFEYPTTSGGALTQPARCRIDYGFAIATAQVSTPPVATVNYGPYVVGTTVAVDADAIVIYGHASPCPARIVQ